MEVNPILFWNGLLTLVIAPAIWVFRGMFMEVKRLDILLNKTREEYAKRDDVKEDMHTVMDALQRLEDKLDKIYGNEMAEEPQVAGKDVKDYMGEQAVNPLMPNKVFIHLDNSMEG